LLRFWTSGSVTRAVIRKQKKIKFRFHDKGIYSVIRQPYFAADFLIVLGLSLPLIHPALILLSLFLFLLLYMPVLFAREMILSHLHPVSYVRYCEAVPFILPSFRHYKPLKTRFRWRAALEKEGNLLAVTGMLLYGIEQFRDFQIQGSFDWNPWWTLFVLPFFFLYLALRTFDRHLEEFPANPDILD